MSKIKIIYRPPKELVPYANNPKLHNEDIPKLKADISEFGFVAPILVAGNDIVDGHGRHLAALEMGLQEIPTVDVSHLTTDQIKALRLVMNDSAYWAKTDEAKKLSELADIEIDMSVFGYDPSEYDFNSLSATEFGSEFSLPDGDKNPICAITFTLHEQQLALIEDAIDTILQSGAEIETFGNQNKKGNALYEVVRQWAEQRQ